MLVVILVVIVAAAAVNLFNTLAGETVGLCYVVMDGDRCHCYQ